jgi:hypothetical protein
MIDAAREIPRPAGESAGLRDDAGGRGEFSERYCSNVSSQKTTNGVQRMAVGAAREIPPPLEKMRGFGLTPSVVERGRVDAMDLVYGWVIFSGLTS